MRIILTTILLFIALISFGISKVDKRSVLVKKLISNGTIYLSKIDIGKGTGTFQIKAKKRFNDSISNLRIGIFRQQNYDEFTLSENCNSKKNIYLNTTQLAFKENLAEALFQVNQTERESIWYIYLYLCEGSEIVNFKSYFIDFQLSLSNNGSWFGQNENLIPEYLAVIILWFGITLYYSIPIFKSIRSTQLHGKFFIYLGFFSLIFSYFYRMLYLISLSYTGIDIIALNILADCFKIVIEGILVGVMMSIVYGWSILTLKHDRFSIFLGLYMMVGNIICAVMDIQDSADKHHHLDKFTLPILLSLRGGILFVFIFGARKTLSKSVGKINLFIRKFTLWGSVYLLGWPVGLLLCENLLPNYMHKQVMVLIEECAHVIGNGFMCHSFAITTSEFSQVDKQNQSFLPD